MTGTKISWPGLPKLKMKMSKLGDVLSKLVQLKHITYEGMVAKPPEAGRFLEKQAISMPLHHIPHVFKAISKN